MRYRRALAHNVDTRLARKEPWMTALEGLPGVRIIGYIVGAFSPPIWTLHVMGDIIALTIESAREACMWVVTTDDHRSRGRPALDRVADALKRLNFEVRAYLASLAYASA